METLEGTRELAPPESVESIVADVREADQIDEALARILQTGPLDILVNNAGGQFLSAAEQILSLIHI